MASKNSNTNNTSIDLMSLPNVAMDKDSNFTSFQEGSYTHARGAVNNTEDGDKKFLATERANMLCTQAPYEIFSTIPLYDERHVIFSTDEVNSEIGIFDAKQCSYETVVNDKCLNFSKQYLITGSAKEMFDCTWQIYFADNYNPDRVLNINRVPYKGEWVALDSKEPDCLTFVPNQPLELDCDKIRLAPLVSQPCLKVSKGSHSGELLNGTYYVTAAYTVNQQRVCDYFTASNSVSIFSHTNVSGSLDISVEGMNKEFYEEFELVLISVVNNQTVAKHLGYYSTETKNISIDKIDERYSTVPISDIVMRNVSYEKSQAIYRNGDYLLRVEPSGKFSFNYQRIANNINTKYVVVEYPAFYYGKGGTNVGYLRDEVYVFFIRWIYNTGDKSESYVIPGRAPKNVNINGTVYNELDDAPVSLDALEYNEGLTPKIWEVYNTAQNTPLLSPIALNDGGYVIAKGEMAYHESSEKYPDDKPLVWSDLCGKNIRLHKMPEQGIDVNTLAHHASSGVAINGEVIRILGVEFDNIQPPLDNNGLPIPGIVGYEILRGSREGNKSIVAKGIVNSMGSYVVNTNGVSKRIHYPNYPFNDTRKDPYLSTFKIDSACNDTHYGFENAFSKKLFTFHSPDTQFKSPYLSAKEIKVYGEMQGIVEGGFKEVAGHPKHKMVTDFSFALSAIAGLGLASLHINGETKLRQASTTKPGYAGQQYIGLVSGASTAIATVPSTPFNTDIYPVAEATITVQEIAAQAGEITEATMEAANTALLNLPAGLSTSSVDPTMVKVKTENNAKQHIAFREGSYEVEIDPNGKTGLTGAFRILNAIPSLAYYWSEGTNTVLEIIRNLLPYKQYAMSYRGHCLYSEFKSFGSGTRRKIKNAEYIDDALNHFENNRVNNLLRSKTVGLDVINELPDTNMLDNSRVTIGDLSMWDDPEREFTRQSAVKYVGLKQRLRNQYGQLHGVLQVPTMSCMQPYNDEIKNTTSDIIFGGDTYVTRYTEKNTFYFFYNWMQKNMPDGYEMDYSLYSMMPYPRYWMDTKKYDASSLLRGMLGLGFLTGNFLEVPSKMHHFDRNPSLCGLGVLGGGQGSSLFAVSQAYMYLFSSGVRDFYVESEVNTEYRDWDDEPGKRHYDPLRYTDMNEMFDLDNISAKNYYKYDYSLSASKQYTQNVSWGSLQERDYNPALAETCYTRYKKRLLYSLPQSVELKRDNWRVYLTNNYKDFTSKITCVKPVGKTGALILFESESPVEIISQDTLQTDGGVKIILGDGGLFARPIQNIENADNVYEYASCQDRLSVINSPGGLYWMSANQGKIFTLEQRTKEISRRGMKFWFEKFLPYKLLNHFPKFQMTQNPVIGIGCQSVYDADNDTTFFCKKDYEPKPNVVLDYVGGVDFIDSFGRKIKLGDPEYFDDVSWTISWDPTAGPDQTGGWVSFHDWHPDLTISSRNSFFTIKGNQIWKHNSRCDLFCNFYGVDTPFEVESSFNSGDNVTVVRSYNYMLESYVYDSKCYMRNHVLDNNFDHAVIYNTEQISGKLNLNLYPKNDVIEAQKYPIINNDSIDILYSKEEQILGFNTFWDITRNRGEFDDNFETMFILDGNGYTWNINPNYVNYNKDSFERKKFRHYMNKVWLQKSIVGNKMLIFKLVKSKNVLSLR